MKVLVISRNQHELERVPLSRATMTIGRSPSNDVVLRAPKVAPCHFLLEWVGVGNLDLRTTDWSITDISRLTDEGSSGLLLDEGAVNLDGFKFEIREDKLEASPNISGRVLEFTQDQAQANNVKGDFSHQFLELMVVRRDSSSVEDVVHLKPEKIKGRFFPVTMVPALQIRRDANQLKIILFKMPDALVYNRGQKIPFPSGAIVLGPEDLVQLVWGKYQIFMRFVTRQKVPFVGRASILDPLLRRLIIVAVLLYIIVFGLILSRMNFDDTDEIKPLPRLATVEIKTLVEAPPPPPPPVETPPTKTEPVPPAKEANTNRSPKPKTSKARMGIPRSRSDKAGEAATPKYANPTQSKSKIGLNSPATVTNTNTIGLLGGLGKAAKGAGVSADRILNQGVVPDSVSQSNDASATVNLKVTPSGVLGSGTGGDPRGEQSSGNELVQATTSFANSDKYNPNSSGPIAREGAKGLGWQAGSSLGKGGSGVAGGSVSGRGDIGSISVNSLVVEGGLDRETVRRIIHANRGSLRTCYESALLTRPDILGRIIYKWQISPRGPVLSAQLQKTTMNSPVVEGCVLRVIKGMQFPAAPNGQPTIVIYPFEFRPSN